ncbi:hypothetical protein [Methylorubrum aminovorans]|uniref:hypothetical protein n=1 Tax=Methylorubrum aminovorans TaxID=269069 RepID=UPI003C3090B0
MDAEAALAPLLAAHQQVAAERDEARERVEKLEADVRAAVVEIGNQARARGEAEGALRVSEMASIVDGWRVRALAAEAALATANAELARRQKALLLLLPFVDFSGGEGLLWVEEEAANRPEMDAGDLCVAAANALGLDFGGEAYLALTEDGHRSITALARAATAREGQADE